MQMLLLLSLLFFLLVVQNLLQKKGFDTKQQIRITSSSHGDSIRASLNEMLLIMRIINLDEVICYFVIAA